MGCSMMVFVNVTEDENGCDIIDQKDQEAFRIRIQAPENRVKLAERLRNKMEYDLMEDYKGHIDYIKEYIPDVSQDSDSFILGTEFPERIKTCVQNWNVENAKQCIRKFQNLEQQAEKEGFETLSQFLTAKISKTGTFEEIHYPASLYELRKALDAAGGIFSYGSLSNLAYFTYEDENGIEWPCHGVTMEEKAMDFVLAHPERYALIEIVYD